LRTRTALCSTANLMQGLISRRITGMSARNIFYLLGSVALVGYLWTLGGVFRALGVIIVAIVVGLEIRGLFEYRQEQKAYRAKVEYDAGIISRQRAKEDEYAALAELSTAEKAAREDATALAQVTKWAEEHVAWSESCISSPEMREQHKRESASKVADATANADKSKGIAEKLRAAFNRGTLVEEWKARGGRSLWRA
jgi:hypothetical protein